MARRSPATMPQGPDAVLTAREAAKYLRLALPTFYRYLWEGKIPSSKIGGRYRFKKAVLDLFFSSRRRHTRS